MKNEFVLAFNEVLEEKQLPKDVILEALEAAMVSAYRRAVNASNAQHVDAKIDPETGKVIIYAEKEVVESAEDERTEVSLTNALKVDAEAKIGGMVVVESTPHNFGRVAAQTARQVIQQRIREAERDAQFTHYTKQVGEIMSGVVQATNQGGVTLGLDMKAEGLMPRNQMISNERFHVHDRVRALLLEVKNSPRGPQIILSRAHRNFLRRLLENEVPEIFHGMVEVRSIAREPGQRSKVAVAGLQPGVDPVGACVGIRGVRIQAIVRELNDEKIDVIEWNADPSVYIAKALSPARVSGVYLNEAAKGAKTATVVVPEDQLSLAIGRDGQNARLAAKLTSWRIDIKSLPEAATDALHKLQNDGIYAVLAQAEKIIFPQVEAVLAKKAEGRPVTPEEYLVLTQFVDRVERGVIRQRQTEKKVEDERLRAARAAIPDAAYEMPIGEFKISDRVYAVISEAGFQNVGDLMLQMNLDSDGILRLPGMGPKAMKELESALAELTFPEPETVEAAAPEAVAAPEALAEAPAAVEAVAAPVVAEAPAPEAVEAAEPVAAAPEAATEAGVPQAVEASAVEAPVAGAPETGAPEAGAPEAGVPVAGAPVAGAPEAGAPEAEPAAGAPEAVTPEAGAPETVPAQAGEEELVEDLFTLRPEVFDYEPSEGEEEEEDDDDKKKKKKKKKKFVEVEYDPDKDAMIVKKKRKRTGEWSEDW